jgi:peptidyl-prolyl cis-trans isomerase SurA
MVMAQLNAQQTQPPPMNILQKQVLDQLILESLQLQIGKRAGVTINDAEIDQHIMKMRASNNISEELFEQQLVQQGITNNMLREQIRRDMIIDQVQRGSVNRRIKVSDQEVKNFLKSKQGKFWSSPDYELGHLVIPVPSGASSKESKALEDKANDIYQRLQAGEDFRQIAVSESKGGDALKGGDMGWKKLAQLPDLFSDALENMEAGQITPPLRSGAGYHILKVYDIRGDTEQVIDQAKVRHILLQTSAILNDKQAEEKLNKLRQEIINGADFGELAKKHSEDNGSVLSGGELGWSLPGKFVPEFEEAINNTPTGEISRPFRSQFGWHIVYIEERRTQDMSETVRVNQANRILRNRRFEEERMNWLQEIHSDAYIDFRT